MCSLSSLTGVKPCRSPTNSYPWTSLSEGLQYNIHLGSFTTYQASTYILIHSYILIDRKIHIHSHAHTTQHTFSTGADIVLHTYIHTYSDLVSSFTYSTCFIICCIGQSLSVSWIWEHGAVDQERLWETGRSHLGHGLATAHKVWLRYLYETLR